MADKNIRLKISETGAKKTSNSIGKVDGRLKSMAKSAVGVGIAYFGARGLISAFQGAIEAAGKQELAEKKLQTALGKTSKALLNQASALQQVTMFGDEDIIMMQSMLAAFTKNEDEIQKLTVATLDLASGMGIDLRSAGDLLAKTIGSSTNALSRYGISVEGAVGSNERLESLTGNIAKLFGGQAKAQTETMTGSIEQMKNAVGDTAEALGDLLGPTVIKAAKALKSAAEFAGDFLTGLKNLKEFGDTGGLEAVKKQSDSTVIGYQNLTKALAHYRGEANRLGVDLKKLSQDSLMNDEGEIRSKREQIEFIKAAVEKQLAFLLKRETEHNESLREMRFQMHEEEVEMLGDIALTEEEIAFQREQFDLAEQGRRKKRKNDKEKEIIAELKQASLVQGSAEDAMKAVVRAESMEAVAGLIASILKNVPFPLNTILAAGAGATAAGLIDKGLSKFATGGDFITDGPQMIMVGDNATGRERVQVTPLGTPATGGGQGGISINFNAPVTNDDYVRDFIIPEIQKATRMNLA